MSEEFDRPEHDRFPSGSSGKTYGLMCTVDADAPAVEAKPEKSVQSWPAAFIRELLLFIVVVLVLSLIALYFDAPLEEPANALHPPNPAKAPWYFLGLQEMVGYDAFWGGIGIPGILAGLAMLAPYLERKKGGEGVWFHSSRILPNLIFITLFVTLGVLTVIGTLFRGQNWAFIVPW